MFIKKLSRFLKQKKTNTTVDNKAVQKSARKIFNKYEKVFKALAQE